MGIDPKRVIKRILLDGKDFQLVGPDNAVNKLPQILNKTVVELTADELYGITSIPTDWQKGNTYLKKVELPGTLESLGGNILSGCTNLEECILHDGIQSINVEGFIGNTAIKSFIFPPSLISVHANGGFSKCTRLKEVIGLKKSPYTLLDSNGLFQIGCSALETVKGFDVRNEKSFNNWFTSCTNLKNFYVYSINANCNIGAKPLTKECLIHLAQQLINKTGTTACTLTIGSANKAKIADVYVKLIDTITEEMIEDDDLIEQKLPCIVCESTDEGAMLLEDYIYLKNWKLA